MKKTFTKLAGGIMAASMILGTAGVAAPQVFADDNVTITQNSDDKGTHTYSAYKIFDGTFNKDDQNFTVSAWGNGIDESKLVAGTTTANAILTALGVDPSGDISEYTTKKEIGGEEKTILDPVQISILLGKVKSGVTITGNSAYTSGANAETAEKFAAAIKDVLSTTTTDTAENVKSTDTAGLELADGYYIITDSVTTNTGKEGVSKYILKLVAAESEESNDIHVKSSVPTSQKNVKDINDTTEAELQEWNKTADHDIGDVIPYELVATLGDGTENYKDYYLNYTDIMCESLVLDESSVKVVVDYEGDGTETVVLKKTAGNDKGYTITSATKDENSADYTIDLNDGTTSKATKWDIEIIDLFTATGVDRDKIGAGTTITVYYNATLTGNVKLNATGNPNEYTLTYNKDANKTGKGTPGTTPEDRNVVFTYTYDIDKVNQSEDKLEGAAFTLYKEINGDLIKDGTGENAGKKVLCVEDAETGLKQEIVVTKGSDLTFTDGVEHSKIKADKYYIVKSIQTITGDASKFRIEGIDDGHYVLVETTVPDSYNAKASIEFDVDATHNNETKVLDTLQVKNLSEADTVGVKANNNGLYSKIVNKSGTELPSTGGIGTTIFYIVGAAAAVTAIVLLTTRRRANKED